MHAPILHAKMNVWELTLNRLKVAMINFVIVAALGCLLRYYFFQPFSGFVYPYTLHAHSHLAFLGWVFLALYSFLLYAFLPDELIRARKYSLFFLIFQVANMGMLFTFPFTGYALWSIVFSSVHAVASMVFAVMFITDAHKHLKPTMRMSFAFAKWSLILMFISNFGPFALGPIMAKGLGYSDIYYLVIYFYLHFQYNGWFTFAVIALLLWYMQKKGIQTDTPPVKLFFWLKLVAIFPAYILSALWLQPSGLWYLLAGIGGALQLIGLVLFLVVIVKHYKLFVQSISGGAIVLCSIGLLSIGAQHLLQFLSAIPSVGDLAFANRNIIIAYLHLVLIGAVSVWLLFFLRTEKFFKDGLHVSGSLYVFLSAFILTEFILLFQSKVPNQSFWLLALALVQLFSLVSLFLGMKRTRYFSF